MSNAKRRHRRRWRPENRAQRQSDRHRSSSFLFRGDVIRRWDGERWFEWACFAPWTRGASRLLPPFPLPARDDLVRTRAFVDELADYPTAAEIPTLSRSVPVQTFKVPKFCSSSSGPKAPTNDETPEAEAPGE